MNSEMEIALEFYNDKVGNKTNMVTQLFKSIYSSEELGNSVDYKFTTYSSAKGVHGKHLQILEPLTSQLLCSILFQIKRDGGNIKVEFNDDEKIYIEEKKSIDGVINKIKQSLNPQKLMKKKLQKKTVTQWNTDPKIKKEIIELSGYKCFFNEAHDTFNKESDLKPYMEAHHIIPMNSQDDFDCSLDIVENLASLCPACHREVHHGENKNKMIERLYNNRKDKLSNFNIRIKLSKLVEYY